MRRLLISVIWLFLAVSAPAQEVTGSPAVTAQYEDPETIERITLRLAGRARESWDTVLAGGDPPLTWGTMATLSLLLHECFDAQMTEAEAELVAKRMVDAYERADAAGRRTLTGEWQQMLDAIGEGGRAAVRTRLEARLKSATGWASAVREALDRRKRTLHQASAPRPGWAAAREFDSTMSVADLDASMELLYFMWVAAGRDPELVALEDVAAIRTYFIQNFAMLPGDMQYALANGQKIYAGLRVLWYTGDQRRRAAMARDFNAELTALGLPDPNGGGGESAWSDVAGKSRSDFAAEMVVGLAGSSYKSAW